MPTMFGVTCSALVGLVQVVWMVCLLCKYGLADWSSTATRSRRHTVPLVAFLGGPALIFLLPLRRPLVVLLVSLGLQSVQRCVRVAHTVVSLRAARMTVDPPLPPAAARRPQAQCADQWAARSNTHLGILLVEMPHSRVLLRTIGSVNVKFATAGAGGRP